MTTYKVTAPNRDFTGERGGVAFAKGEATIDEQHAAELAYFRSAGYAVEEQPEAGGEPVAELPVESASKADWVAAAVARGMDQADADKATKQQLIEQLTTKGEPQA